MIATVSFRRARFSIVNSGIRGWPRPAPLFSVGGLAVFRNYQAGPCVQFQGAAPVVGADLISFPGKTLRLDRSPLTPFLQFCFLSS